MGKWLGRERDASMTITRKKTIGSDGRCGLPPHLSTLRGKNKPKRRLHAQSKKMERSFSPSSGHSLRSAHSLLLLVSHHIAECALFMTKNHRKDAIAAEIRFGRQFLIFGWWYDGDRWVNELSPAILLRHKHNGSQFGFNFPTISFFTDQPICPSRRCV
jgi:hypothetical protein